MWDLDSLRSNRLAAATRPASLGTSLCITGDGERLNVLRAALGEPTTPGNDHLLTNIRLTGYPITEYDRERVRLYLTVTLTAPSSN